MPSGEVRAVGVFAVHTFSTRGWRPEWGALRSLLSGFHGETWGDGDAGLEPRDSDTAVKPVAQFTAEDRVTHRVAFAEGSGARFLTRDERELREPLVWRQGSQVPMRWLGV